jgi:hypothetical protein
VHVIDLVDNRRSALAEPGHHPDDVRAADVLAPRPDQLEDRQRGELGRLDHHRAPGGERRDRVADRQQERKVPRRDNPDHRERPVDDLERLRLHQRAVGADPLLGEETS